MKVVLAEKPSVGRELASVLGASSRREGYMEGNGWAVTWAFGHLVELQEPREYHAEWGRWSLETLPMLPEAFGLRPRGDAGAQRQLKVIHALFDRAELLVCATDAGREGELIFRYIRQWAGVEKTPFKRLWLQSLTPEAIRAGVRASAGGAGLRQSVRGGPLSERGGLDYRPERDAVSHGEIRESEFAVERGAGANPGVGVAGGAGHRD